MTKKAHKAVRAEIGLGRRLFSFEWDVKAKGACKYYISTLGGGGV